MVHRPLIDSVVLKTQQQAVNLLWVEDLRLSLKTVAVGQPPLQLKALTAPPPEALAAALAEELPAGHPPQAQPVQLARQQRLARPVRVLGHQHQVEAKSAVQFLLAVQTVALVLQWTQARTHLRPVASLR
jgi:hypothetical protein